MNSELLIGLLGIGLSLISLYTSYLFYKKSLRIKIPLFAIESRGSIGGLPNELSKLTLRYDNEIIQYFTTSRIAIWNAGEDTIKREDLVDLITIAPEIDYKILDAKIIKEIEPSNKFRINFTENKIKVDFDYIDKNQGCCVEIHHTGKTSWALNVSGTIHGVGKIRQATHIPYPHRRKKALKFSLITFLFGVGVSFLVFSWSDQKIVETIVIVNLIIASILYGITPAILSILYFRRNKTSLILGVADDDQLLQSPDFPPTGRVRKKDKDADPVW